MVADNVQVLRVSFAKPPSHHVHREQSLSCINDKRYLLLDDINSPVYGHCDIVAKD